MSPDPYGPAMRPWRVGFAVGGLAFLGIFVAWTQQRWGGEGATRTFVDLAAIVLPIVAATAAFIRAHYLPRDRRIAWALLGGACLSWAIGAIGWSYFELGHGILLPFPSLADVGYLGTVPLAAAALMTIVVGGAAVTSRLRTLMDGLLVSGALLFVSYAVLLRPVMEYAQQQPGVMAKVLAIAYPLSDVMLLSLLLIVASRAARGIQRTLAWMAAGLVALTFADVGFWYLTARGAFATGAWTETGWAVGFLCLAYAGIRPVQQVRLEPMRSPGVAVAALPLVPFALAMLVAIGVQMAEGQLEPFLFWNAVVVVCMLAARQFVMLLENLQLRRKAEAALAEARSQETMRSQMLSTITHDLVAPLSPMTIHLDLIDKRGPLTPAQEQSLVALRRGTGQIERLARDLKDLAHVQSGRFSIELAPVDIGRLVDEAVAALRPQAERDGVALEAEPGATVLVRGDRDRLGQVVLNVLGNALRFTPAGGHVRVRCVLQASEVMVQVQDTGRGLTEEEIGRLFRPFVQVHRRGEAREKGTGLGLYISRTIAEQHGGALRVASAGRGHGATFTLSLPRA